MFPSSRSLFPSKVAQKCLQFHSQPSILDGVRVLDMTRIVAGPYCTQILADLGAEVIKIERPKSGDEARKWGPPFVNSTSCYFLALNRNKKSVCIDIKSSRGQEILRQLAVRSDVLVENYIPGKLDEYALGFEQLSKIVPRLIYCSITGYGPRGPYRNKPGYDVIAASVGGLLHITGHPNGEPVKPGVALTDISTGLYAHGAILAALYQRTTTGKGQKIDCNLLSTQISTLINIGSNFLNACKEATRWGTQHESIVPYQAFRTTDGYFTIGTGSEEQFKDFCRLIDCTDLSKNSKFLTNQKRVENREELLCILQGIISKKSNDEWKKIFENSSFPCGPVNTIKETFSDPHVKEIGLVQELDGVKVVGPPVVYSDGGNCVRTPPPALGEHTDEVLRNVLGLNEEDIDKLRINNVIQ